MVRVSGAPLIRFGRARIEPLPTGTYRTADVGQWAVVLEVHDCFDDLVDLVAWFPDDPTRWWLRHGDETPILGVRALAIATWYGEPIQLYGTPELWLHAHSRAYDMDTARGICILQPGVDLKPLLDGVSRVDCENAELKDILRRAMRAWEPKLRSPAETDRHAA